MTARLRTAVLVVMALGLALPLASAGAEETGSHWYRMSYAERITSDDRSLLDRLGAEAVQYDHPDRYVAWMDTSAADRARGHEGVTDVRRVEPAEKLDHRLRRADGPVRVEVIAHASRAREVSSRLAALGVVLDRYQAAADGSLTGWLGEVPAAAVLRIAEDDAVIHIAQGSPGLRPEGEASAQVLAGALTPDSRGVIGPGYRDFLAEHDLDGDGVTVSIVDTGVDDGHPDLTGRMVDRIDYSRLPMGDPYDAGGHGTHVAGIAVGGGGELPSLGTPTDADGFRYGLGIAPAAGYLDQPAISRTRQSLPPPGGFEAITRDAVRAGAVAWNASWTDGGGPRAGYVANARMMDALVRDADFDSEGAQPFSLVFSAGNSGGNGITSPKEAKNIIAVGSTASPYAGDIRRVSSWSSRGPAHDGRVMPTVVAPGETVAAARSRLPAEACNVVDTGSGRPLPPDGYGMHAFCSGTSMAAPQVTGSIALIHQWWRRQLDGADPSPAMVKALLVNTATPVREIPSITEGWGRVNLRALFDPAAARLYEDQGVVFTGAGDEHHLEVDVVDPTQPLRVTLVWTDAPAMWDAEVALVNDLDLEVTAADGTTFRGNHLDLSFSLPGGAPDRINNVENVFIEAPAQSYRVSVRAHNLPDEGVPGAGRTSQDFALVVSNAVTQP